MKKHTIVSLSAALALASSVACAEVPTLGNQPQLLQIPVQPKTTPDVTTSRDVHTESTLPSGTHQTVHIMSYRFVGDTSPLVRELGQIVAPYVNKDLSIEQIDDITIRITKYYREKGYFVARAYVEPHAYHDGVLTITILKGTFNKVMIDNSSLASDTTVQSIGDALKKSDMSASAVERAILLMSDLAGVHVESADIMPSNHVGESDLRVKTTSIPRFDGYVVGDNYGSVYTGLYRYSIGANANSPLGIGDRLSVFGMMSDGGGSKNGSVSYGAPVMHNGLYVSGGYYRNDYALGNDYAALDATGTISALQATVSYPVIRSKVENLTVSINPQMQFISDKQLGEDTKKKIGLAVFGVDYSKLSTVFSRPFSFAANVNYTLGNMTFENGSDAAYDKVTTNTQGTFNKVSATISGTSHVTQDISFKNTLNTQYALGHKNLDGTQAMTIGGAYAIKAFPLTQESSSNGYVYTAELAYQLPNLIQGYTHSISTFYDVGRAFMSNSDSPSGTISFNDQLLQDAGVGYSASYKKFFGKIQLAQVVGGTQVQGVDYYNTKLLFQAGLAW